MLKSIIDENFADKKLIVVSNREPYIHKRSGSGIKVETPAGGLTSAMDDVLKSTGGTWVAWGSGSADRDTVNAKACVSVPPGQPAYTLKRVWLSTAEVEDYYHGYSNQVLWPLCHIALDRVYFRRRFWEGYEKANRAFADAVLEEAEGGATVWVHDYHMALVPGMLRERNPALTIAHFWHIPWPDWSVFRACPQSREVLEGLLGNDLIGFQIPLFVKNFLACVRECLDAEIDEANAAVIYQGHTTRLKAFPISIDFDKFNAMALSRRAGAAMQALREKYRIAGPVGVGVDRLEYTKALIKRLQAISLFFEQHRRFRGKFTFIQIAVPTRMTEPYISYKEAVEALIEKINKRFSQKRWKPIVYIDTKVEHRDLVAYYRMADVAIVSSIYDGMNLVAKEFVAAQVDGQGVLILSEFAGAAEELEGALLVNPYDVESFSESIHRALTMSAEGKREMMLALRKMVSENDIYRWITDILQEILHIASVKSKGPYYFFDHAATIRERIGGARAFLFLDFDGTLAAIAPTPDKAVIPDETREVLQRLRQRMPVAVISGRELADVMARVGIEDLVYAGNHGAEIWDGKRKVKGEEPTHETHLLREFLSRLRTALAPFEEVMIEDKGVTASIHYRHVRIKDLGRMIQSFTDVAGEYAGAFRITSGKKVFEIRPLKAWNKGDAVLWLTEHLGKGTIPVFIGDDTTDEDAYRAIRGTGISVSIGENLESNYYLKSQKEVREFLKSFL